MKHMPLNSKLPGKYGKMTAKQMDAEVANYDKPGVAEAEFKKSTPAQRAAHSKKRRVGRPHKPANEKAVPVLITFEPLLLAELDARARTDGKTRAGRVKQYVREALGAA